MNWTSKLTWKGDAYYLLVFLKDHDVTRAKCEEASKAYFNYGLSVGASPKCKAHTNFYTFINIYGQSTKKADIVLNSGEYYCYGLMYLFQEVCNVANRKDMVAADAKAKDKSLLTYKAGDYALEMENIEFRAYPLRLQLAAALNAKEPKFRHSS
jgi:hypothetical protein